jgi:hypothetical protein
MNLDEMPLDSKEHCRDAWQLVTYMLFRHSREKVAGRPAPSFIPSEEELVMALAMIRLAAEQLGMSFTEDGRPVS